jgi:DNA-binding response OmpR family regulator
MSRGGNNAKRRMRVLVAEDNVLISIFLEQILTELEFTVIGPFHDLDQTLQGIRTNEIDGALLDVLLGEVNILPAADALARRGVPFILTTGDDSPHALSGLPADAPLLLKPFEMRQLADLMSRTFRPRIACARQAL